MLQCRVVEPGMCFNGYTVQCLSREGKFEMAKRKKNLMMFSIIQLLGLKLKLQLGFCCHSTAFEFSEVNWSAPSFSPAEEESVYSSSCHLHTDCDVHRWILFFLWFDDYCFSVSINLTTSWSIKTWAPLKLLRWNGKTPGGIYNVWLHSFGTTCRLVHH